MRNNKVHAIEVVEAASFPKNEVEDDRPSEEEEKKGTEATAEVTDENQGTVGLEHQYVKLLSEYCHYYLLEYSKHDMKIPSEMININIRM